jgi:transcriptional regulator with XRE-family HTH domain
MPSDADTFASLLAGIQASGLSNRQIAQRAGLSTMTVWRIETGTARHPSFDTYLRLARVYERTTGQPVPPLQFGRR